MRTHSIIMLISMVLSLKVASAQQLSDVALYHRCHNQIVGERPSSTDNQLIAIRNKTLSATQACLNLLDLASLNGQGMISSTNPSAQKILARWKVMHQSFFSNNDIDTIQGNEFNKSTHTAFDGTLQSLYLTKSLFDRNFTIDKILNSNEEIFAIRTNPRADSKFGPGQDDFNEPVQNIANNMIDRNEFYSALAFTAEILDANGLAIDYTNKEIFTSPVVQLGMLSGIGIRTNGFGIINNLSYNTTFRLGTFYFTNLAANTYGPQWVHPQKNFNINRNFGAGVIGSAPYILMNIGHPLDYQPNGTTKLPRRWSQSVFNDFLCRDLGVLRENDIFSYVRPTSPVSFRNSSTCVRCHATIDQMASTLRNLKPANSSAGSTRGRTTSVLANYPVTMPADQGWTDQADANYHLRPPTGKLLYRRHDGKLVDRNVASLTDLSAQLAQEPDFYVCMAKKYFRLFTGIDVPILDEGDPNSTETFKNFSAADLSYYKFIKDLGYDLEKSKSSMNLVKKIISSPYYQQKDFGRVN